jgi:hypothetical protein
MKNEAYRKARAAFELLGVTNFKDLSIAYSAADQELMKKGIWYHKGNSVPNLVKTLIENIDPEELDEKDKQWWREIMWFWYHHAISSALRMSGDRMIAQILAQTFATRALEFQDADHPNKITRLLYLLVHGQVREAEEWWGRYPSKDEVEHETGLELIEDTKNDRLFPK